MISFKDFINESIKILSDDKVDKFIRDNWDSVTTFEYNIEASFELAKVLNDVVVTKDMKTMHIDGILDDKSNKAVSQIVKKFNLKEL